MTAPDLTCPKCQSPMRSYERNRVLVDQCTGCGGLFLDKGELEQLSAAETTWHERDRPQTQPGGHDRHGGHGRPHKRRSFLSELFDD